MKALVFAIRFATTAIVLFASAHASAVGCTPGVPCVPEIVVTDTREQYADPGSGSYYGGGVGGAVAGGGGGGGISTEAIVMTIRTVCQKSGETCAQWGQRMVSQMTPTSPPPMCSTLFATAGYSAISACRTEVTLETSVNSCANVPSCP